MTKIHILERGIINLVGDKMRILDTIKFTNKNRLPDGEIWRSILVDIEEDLNKMEDGLKTQRWDLLKQKIRDEE